MKKWIALVLTSVNVCFGLNWTEVFDAYRDALPQDSVILQQYLAFVSSDAPPIADPRIKKIPIYENGEDLVDLRQISFTRLQMMPDPSFPFERPSCNSGLPSGSKMRVRLFIKLQEMVEAIDSLAPQFGYEPGQISIRVFEGLRDLGVQKELFLQKVHEILLANPEWTREMAEQETCKWVSPYKNNVPVHSTGAAVDIRLWDEQSGDFLDLGPFGVIWGSNQDAPTFSEGCSDSQKKNRLFCLIAAEKAGLTNYPYEFWHFSSGDRVAAYWTESDPDERRAFYGSIHETKP